MSVSICQVLNSDFSDREFQLTELKLRPYSLNHCLCVAYRSSGSGDYPIFKLWSSNTEYSLSAYTNRRVTISEDLNFHLGQGTQNRTISKYPLHTYTRSIWRPCSYRRSYFQLRSFSLFGYFHSSS